MAVAQLPGSMSRPSTSRPGPTNSASLRSGEASAGTATLWLTAEGQNGAVAGGQGVKWRTKNAW